MTLQPTTRNPNSIAWYQSDTINKRLGWTATAVFLEINGVGASSANNDDVYDLVIGVASAPSEVDAIASRLRMIIEPDARG